MAIRLRGFLARFNRWFEGAAVAQSAGTPDQSHGVDAIAVKTGLGEVEKETVEETAEQEEPPRTEP